MNFFSRSEEKEILDLRPLTPEENLSAFKLISLVNRWLGGTNVILSYLKKFSKKWRANEVIRILDLGTGISDIPEAILHWSKVNGFRVEVTALDISFESLKLGRKAPGLSLVQASCFELPFSGPIFDYVTASMFFHHLSDAEILTVLKKSESIAKRGIIINDLERSKLSYAGFWLLTLFINDGIFRNDGLISIQKGFVAADLKKWISKTGFKFLSSSKHFIGRIALAGEK